MIRLLFLASFFFITSLFSFTIYEDTSAIIQPSEIVKYKDKFEKPINHTVRAYKTIVWLKYKFTNNTSKSQTKYIQFSSVLLENVDMFFYKDNKLTKKENGLFVPINEREVQLAHFTFKVNIDKNSEQEIFIRIKAKNMKAYYNNIYNDYEELISVVNSKVYILIFASGILFSLLVLIIILYIYKRDNIYLFYLFYSLSTYMVISFNASHLQYLIQDILTLILNLFLHKLIVLQALYNILQPAKQLFIPSMELTLY